MSLALRRRPPQIDFGRLLPHDADAVATIDRRGGLHLAWGTVEWERQLQSNRLTLMGAFVDTVLTGILATEPRHGRIAVVKLSVDPRHRRRGIGAALARRAMARLADPSSTRSTLECVIPTHRDYLPGACLLRALGWQATEIHAGRSYRFQWESALPAVAHCDCPCDPRDLS